MDLFKMLTDKISPVKGLEMLKAGLEKKLNRPIEHFQVDYIATKRDISIKVWLDDEKTIRESWNGTNKETLMFTIESFIKLKFAGKGTLDIASCERHHDGTLTVSVYMTDKEGKKIKEEIKNYKL